jgi:GNAT superfamily N-acetyltransferase
MGLETKAEVRSQNAELARRKPRLFISQIGTVLQIFSGQRLALLLDSLDLHKQLDKVFSRTIISIDGLCSVSSSKPRLMTGAFAFDHGSSVIPPEFRRKPVTATLQTSSPTIRQAKVEDAPAAGRICYEAFRKISTDHDFPPDLPSVEAGVGLLTMMFTHPGFYCVVAESDGGILGSNCLDERSTIAGVGPITIDPEVQNKRLGRTLMEAVLTRSQERGFQGTRLLQAAFHNRSLSLYTKLGFDTREPVSTMQGPAIKTATPGYNIRPALTTDLEPCNQLCQSVHGHDRNGELRDAITQGTAVVAERDGQIAAYATVVGFFGHMVGKTNADVQAIIANADAFLGPGILVPTRNAGLFRWCLENGLRVVQPMTLMTMGFYKEPAGAYLPSILY